MNQPKRYLDIVSDIRDMIRREKIRPGDRIPSERELAETLQVGEIHSPRSASQFGAAWID
nr:GntR family transcriptional regulator [Planococcus glaciei]